MVITEKPTNASKLKADGSEQTKGVESAEDMEALKRKLEVLTNIPKKKYPYPMTAAQEVGWESDNLFDQHRPKYTFNKNMCPETNYVDNYVRMLHRNPLASKKGETKLLQKSDETVEFEIIDFYYSYYQKCRWKLLTPMEN